MNAELVSNRAFARVGDERVIVARVVAGELKLTEEGEALMAQAPAAVEKPKKAQPKKRSRNKNGTLKGDNPSTPDVNEAWSNGDS